MLPLLTLSGSPQAQGFRHGQALKREIRHNLRLYFRRFALEIQLPAAEVLRRAALYLEALERLHPAYVAGIKGIADGSGASLAEIAALNVRYEILYDAFGEVRDGVRIGVDGCTSFALTPEKTGGPLLLGQNWDWLPEVEGAVLHLIHNDAPDVLGFTEAGIFGPKLGLNSAGLGLVINGMTSTDDDWAKLALPFHARCYDALRARDVDAASRAVLKTPRACSGNFMLAAPPNTVRNLEVAPLTHGSVEPEHGVLVHANHFTTAAVEDPNLEEHQGSVIRERQLSGLLERGTVGLEEVQAYLRDGDNAPDALCRYPDPDKPDYETYATVVSAVMNLSEGVLYISDGPPDRAPYQRFVLEPAREPV